MEEILAYPPKRQNMMECIEKDDSWDFSRRSSPRCRNGGVLLYTEVFCGRGGSRFTGRDTDASAHTRTHTLSVARSGVGRDRREWCVQENHRRSIEAEAKLVLKWGVSDRDQDGGINSEADGVHPRRVDLTGRDPRDNGFSAGRWGIQSERTFTRVVNLPHDHGGK